MEGHQFQVLLGLPADIFCQLQKAITQHLQDEPDEAIGLMDPTRDDETQDRFSSWLDDYFDSGVGLEYWGPDTHTKWSLKDKPYILGPLKELVLGKAQAERASRLEKMMATAVARTEGVEDESGKHEESKHHEKPWEGNNNNTKTDIEPYQSPSQATKYNATPQLHQIKTRSKAIKLDPTKCFPTNNQGVPTHSTTQPVGQLTLAQGSLQQSAAAKKKRSRRTQAELLAIATTNASESSSQLPTRKCDTAETFGPPAKRSRQSEPQHRVAHPVAGTRNSVPPTTIDKNGVERVFQTRLGSDKTTIFLFASTTIGLQHFLTRLYRAWREDESEIEMENIELKISIAGLDEYRLSFEDRERNWIHLMGIASSRPESDVVVTVGGHVPPCN